MKSASFVLRSSSKRYMYLFLSCFAAVYFLFAFVSLLDPLEMYRWGPPAELADGQYNDHGNQHLLHVISKTDFDGLVLGGSTLRGLTPKAVSEVFPDIDAPFTFTYGGPRPADQRVVFDKMRKLKGLKRVIVALDWIYMLPPTAKNDGFPFYLYNEEMSDDYRAISFASIFAAYDTLRGRAINVHAWRYLGEEKKDRRYAAMVKPKKIAEFKGFIRDGAADVLAPTEQRCSDLTAVADFLAFVREMADRGVKMDILIPPSSIVAYFEWNIHDKGKKHGKSFLSRQIILRSCVVAEIRSQSNVSVHAFDNEDWLTGDLANYYDSFHIYSDRVYRFILESIRDKTNLLTAENFDMYAITLRNRVSSYKFYNSKVAN